MQNLLGLLDDQQNGVSCKIEVWIVGLDALAEPWRWEQNMMKFSWVCGIMKILCWNFVYKGDKMA